MISYTQTEMFCGVALFLLFIPVAFVLVLSLQVGKMSFRTILVVIALTSFDNYTVFSVVWMNSEYVVFFTKISIFLAVVVAVLFIYLFLLHNISVSSVLSCFEHTAACLPQIQSMVPKMSTWWMSEHAS